MAQASDFRTSKNVIERSTKDKDKPKPQEKDKEEQGRARASSLSRSDSYRDRDGREDGHGPSDPPPALKEWRGEHGEQERMIWTSDRKLQQIVEAKEKEGETKKEEEQEEQERTEDKVKEEGKASQGLLGGFMNGLRVLGALVTNGAYMSAVAGIIFVNFPVVGTTVWAAKAIQSIYFVTASTASYVVGALIPIGILGILFGGWLMVKIKANTAANAKWILLFTAGALAFMACILIGCGGLKLAGANSPYPTFHSPPQSFRLSEAGENLASPCNAGCSCLSKIYNPVCGPGGITYFSPCHAGCSNESTTGAGLEWTAREFTHCLCTMGNNTNPTTPASMLTSTFIPLKEPIPGTVVGGQCSAGDCNMALLAFALLFFAGLFLAFAAQVPKTNVLMRTVNKEHRALSIAFKNGLQVILTEIPAPLVYGSVFDGACILWDHECPESQNCLEYDNWQMRLSVFLLAIIPIGLSLFFFALSWHLLRRKKRRAGREDLPSVSRISQKD